MKQSYSKSNRLILLHTHSQVKNCLLGLTYLNGYMYEHDMEDVVDLLSKVLTVLWKDHESTLKWLQ